MKKLLSSSPELFSADLRLLILRIGIGGLMLTHGIPKLMMLFSGDTILFPGLFGMSPGITLGQAVFAEVFCSILILAGLGTRLATIPLIITMLTAVFFVHTSDPFSMKEPGLLYLLSYFILLLAGSGRYSLDHLLGKQPGVRPILIRN